MRALTLYSIINLKNKEKIEIIKKINMKKIYRVIRKKIIVFKL